MAEVNIYEGIMQGLQEAIEFKNGKKSKARVRVLTTVEPVIISVYKPAEIVRVRRSLDLSQRGLAAAIGVSPRTVESWEAGRSSPNGVATRMLYLIETDHGLLDKLVKRNNN